MLYQQILIRNVVSLAHRARCHFQGLAAPSEWDLKSHSPIHVIVWYCCYCIDCSALTSHPCIAPTTHGNLYFVQCSHHPCREQSLSRPLLRHQLSTHSRHWSCGEGVLYVLVLQRTGHPPGTSLPLSLHHLRVPDGRQQVKELGRVWLHFRGINYSSEISVSGQQIPLQQPRGMFLRRQLDITDAVKTGIAASSPCCHHPALDDVCSVPPRWDPPLGCSGAPP